MSATKTPEKTSQEKFTRKMRKAAHLSRPGDALTAGPEDVRQGLPYKTLDAIRHELGLSQDVLTRVLSVSERTLQRRRGGRLSASESDRLWRILNIHRQTLETFEHQADQARQWLMHPKQALGGDTPVEHLDTEPGERRVEQMLAMIEHTMPV